MVENRLAIHQFASVFSLALMTAGIHAAEIEEIIVTATKRGEVSVQDIAGGVSAFSGQTLEKYNLTSLDEYTKLAPSLQFASQGTGDAQLIIRGIQSPGAGTVGVYFDEAVVTASNFQDGGGRTPDIRLHDIERIEVLKGPQGTLFGASSMSGTLRVITNKPDPSAWDSNVSVSGMDTEHGDASYQLSGMINVPVIDNALAVRGVAWRDELGGYIDNLAGGAGLLDFEDSNDATVSGGRISVRWTPNEDLTVSAFGLAQQVEVDDTQAFYPVASGVLLPVTIVAGPAAGVVVPARPGHFGDLKVTKPSKEPWDDTTYLYGLTLEYDTGFGSALGTVNYLDRDVFSPFDTTPTSTSFGLPGAGIVGDQFQDRSILSMEARFASDLDGPFNFVAGVFYEEDDSFNNLSVVGIDPATGLPVCKDRTECLAQSPSAPTLLFARTLENDIDFYRLFGHIEYEVTDQWTIGGGVAYFDGELRNVEFVTQDLPPAQLPPFLCTTLGLPSFICPPQIGATPGINEKADTSEVTWDASLSYQYSDDQMYYFRAATGFRPGGINDTALARAFGIDVPAAFQPDTVESYEIGAKTSWLENRVTVNLAYFKMFWNDIHVPGEEPTGAFEFIANAAKAEIDGVELEIFARPTDEWYLTFGMTWLDARLTEDQTFPTGFVPLPGTPRGFDGDPIPKVPDWALSGTAEYTVPQKLLGQWQSVLRANFSYTDESQIFFNATDSFNTEIGDYWLLNLNASFYYDQWEGRLFINNVTDELAIVDVDNGIDGYDAFTVRPRTFGAQVVWRFK